VSLIEALRQAEAAIASRNIPDARLEAELLLMHSLGMGRAELYAALREDLSSEQAESFFQLVEQRLRHEPTAYILGSCQFYGIDFHVDSRVLIPRPETELLVEQALDFVAGHFAAEPCTLADVGTGSGAIAVSLALHLPQARIYAIDISPAALEVARVNCRKHEVLGRVQLLEGDMLSPLAGRVNVVIANLPYVADPDLADLMPEIRCFEPAVALAGGADGLDEVRRLLPQAADRVLPGGLVLVEIGQGQATEAVALADSCFAGAKTEVVRDLAGIERILKVMT